MEYTEFKEQILDVTPETKGLMYSLAVMWLHPNRLPLKAVALGNCTDKVIKIPNWSEKTRVLQWANGPRELIGPSVPIISFSPKLFKGNTRITDVILQSNISGIPTGAFDGCVNLQRITIPRSITHIGEATFKDCEKLTDVYYAGSKEEWQKIDIVHELSRAKDPKQLGLHVEIVHEDIPGNEPLLGARIHYNCNPDSVACQGVKLVSGGKDVTELFRVKDV